MSVRSSIRKGRARSAGREGTEAHIRETVGAVTPRDRITTLTKRKPAGRMVNVDLLPKWTVLVTENGHPLRRETDTDPNEALRRARQWAEDNVQFHPAAIVGLPELHRPNV